mgnify:FL=1
MTKSLEEKAENIKLFITDVDGILTDGSIYLGNDGEEFKAFNSQDGMGIKLAQREGIEVAIITGRESKIVERRANELAIEEIYQGIDDKLSILKQLIEKYGIDNDQIAYIGDDLNDLPVLKEVGLSLTAANGVEQVKEEVDHVTKRSGGRGAVREAINLILKLKTGDSGSGGDSIAKKGSK